MGRLSRAVGALGGFETVSKPGLMNKLRFAGSAAVSANAAFFLSKGVLGAPASRWQQFRKNRVWGKQLYVNNDDGVSVFGCCRRDALLR